MIATLKEFFIYPTADTSTRKEPAGTDLISNPPFTSATVPNSEFSTTTVANGTGESPDLMWPSITAVWAREKKFNKQNAANAILLRLLFIKINYRYKIILLGATNKIA